MMTLECRGRFAATIGPDDDNFERKRKKNNRAKSVIQAWSGRESEQIGLGGDVARKWTGSGLQRDFAGRKPAPTAQRRPTCPD